MCCQITQKKAVKLSKMKKMKKSGKNFQKGYLQMGFYVVNYMRFYYEQETAKVLCFLRE